MADINATLNWMRSRVGKVGYSMSYLRQGPNYYDCSSAVFSALKAGGFWPQSGVLGTTETLYAQEGKLLTPISSSDLQAGDVFVAGPKGGSSGGAGHTGFYNGNNQIIHCNYYDGTISITQIAGRTGSPLYWYRLAGVKSGPDTPEVSEDDFDISTVNNGKLTIESAALIEKYGRIQRSMRFEANNPDELLMIAKAYLMELEEEQMEFVLETADLSILDQDFKELKLFNSYWVDNHLMNTLASLRVVERSFSISNPNVKQLSVGKRFNTQTDYLIDQMRRNN